MGTPIYHVDAFCERPFSGNPAAVCLLAGDAEEAWMAAVAAEMNLSETAFVVDRGDGSARFGLRWFTPVVEVELCGHATLASAHVLWETRRVAAGREIFFDSASGRLAAARRGSSIELDFPADPPREVAGVEGLAAALGCGPRWLGEGKSYLFAELASPAELRALDPDYRRLAEIVPVGICVTCRGDGEYDYLSRFFAPAAGIDEDPVTGSAHSLLAPYWSGRLGRERLVGYQASARGGRVETTLAADRVLIAGRAVTVAAGELAV